MELPQGYIEIGTIADMPDNIPDEALFANHGVRWRALLGSYVHHGDNAMRYHATGVYCATPESLLYALTQLSAPPQILPAIPEGWVLLGMGSRHVDRSPADQNEMVLYHHPDGDPGWSSPNPFFITDEHSWFCVAENGPLAEKYKHRIEFYKQFSRQMNQPPFRPLPDNMPPVPAGMVIVGWGNQIPYDRDRPRAPIAWWRIEEDNWNFRENGLLGSGDASHPNELHAYAADNPIVAQFQEAVEFYNPHLRPASPTETINLSARRQWILTLNGAPVASEDELSGLLEPVMASGAHPADLASDLWRALYRDDPEAFVASWADKEPAMLMVDFIHDPSEADVLIPAIAESQKTIGEIITTAAAGVLLRGELGNHFRYTEEGRLVVNPANPPSVEQGCEILRRTLEVRETGHKLDNYSAWTLGMLGDELENFFGDDFDPSMVMAATGRAYNTYITSLKVYRNRWANRKNLSFTHHKEAEYAKIGDEDKDFILDLADKFRMSVAQQRKLTSFIRVYGSSALQENPPDDLDDLMERLEVKSVNKNFLFFLRSENKWFRYRGPFEHIPNGATPIINADTKAIVSSTGALTEMAEWTPVGVEVPYLRGPAATAEAARVAAIASEAATGNPEIASIEIAEAFVDAMEEPGLDDEDEEEERDEHGIEEDEGI